MSNLSVLFDHCRLLKVLGRLLPTFHFCFCKDEALALPKCSYANTIPWKLFLESKDNDFQFSCYFCTYHET